MFRKVNAKEKFLGWYTTSPKKNDIEIHQIFKNYCENAVLVVVDPEHSDPLALPTEAFVEM
jgi:26S proteasome regulatory subunit N8